VEVVSVGFSGGVQGDGSAEGGELMSFYVDTQALQIGLGHFRPDLARLSLADIKVHPDVKVKVERITNPLDSKGEYAAECLTLDVEGIPVLLASAPEVGMIFG